MKATLFRVRLDGVVKRVLIYQTGYIIPELSLKGHRHGRADGCRQPAHPLVGT
jgi:hypothetical protein